MHHYFGNGPTLVLYPYKDKKEVGVFETHLIAKATPR
jgi:hypothetical protein